MDEVGLKILIGLSSFGIVGFLLILALNKNL